MSLELINDTTVLPTAEVGPGPIAEWSTPPAVLSIAVGREAYFDYWEDGLEGKDDVSIWRFDQGVAQTYIPLVLGSLKHFREKNSTYLNDLPNEFEQDLEMYRPIGDWTADPGPSKLHDDKWSVVSTSDSLYRLAASGYDLYDNAFPHNIKLRSYLDTLPPGSLIYIKWTKGDIDYVANIPWGLMYRVPPVWGQPVNANEFFGLRFRIEYKSHLLPNKFTRALGRVGDSHLGHAYYWKGNEGDPVLSEAAWQKQQLARIASHVSIPKEHDGSEITELLGWLADPRPSPMPVLYIYCRARVGTSDESTLEFGDGAYHTDAFTVHELDLPKTRFTCTSFVFFNACESGQKQDAQIQNRLENHFFNRGCAAYLGTVHETPIGLASKYAAAFFHFFYERVDGNITTAGEAYTQAKRFLWHRYRNLGGLFYTYVNEYFLCMADKTERSDIQQKLVRGLK